ncbi:MAG: hypothetical protein UT82_C0002G0024 [Parcubacteria group bacterium GW2011_GWB1_40_14]|nr:MAG: hypothetical protein UT82_C0002G0024 [Parcubacteria group bacterium GW2011_GWB1_40_14]
MVIRKKTILIIFVGIAIGAGYAFFFLRSRQILPAPPHERVVGEVIRTEEIRCNAETYIFETVLTEDQTGYFNNIYRGTNSAEDFATSIKAPPMGGNTFFILAAPQENCNRIYLTVALYETDAPRKGIFAWHVADATLQELSVSENFRSDLAVSYPQDLTSVVSHDGEKVLVAQASEPYSQENYCNLRILALLHLREDEKEVLVQLPDGETLTDFNESAVGQCSGLNLGWIDNSTIYYDVYDATVTGVRPFIERRKLSIK